MPDTAEKVAPPAPADQLAQIASASALEGSLRRRTEGLTWAIWGLVYAGYGMTAAFVSATGGAGLGLGWGAAMLAWEAAGVAMSVGLWRSAALSFRSDLTRGRATVFFLGWWLLFGIVQRVAGAAMPPESGPATALVAFGVLLAAFAAFDPLRFSPLGRRTAAVLAAIALGAAVVALLVPMPQPLALAYVAAVIGVSWCAGGLVALFRG